MESTSTENMLEALIWNLQLPQSMSDDAASHNMRIAKDRLRKFIEADRTVLLHEAAERGEMKYSEGFIAGRKYGMLEESNKHLPVTIIPPHIKQFVDTFISEMANAIPEIVDDTQRQAVLADEARQWILTAAIIGTGKEGV